MSTIQQYLAVDTTPQSQLQNVGESEYLGAEAGLEYLVLPPSKKYAHSQMRAPWDLFQAEYDNPY